MFHCPAFFSQCQGLDTSLLWSFHSDFIYDRVQCLIEVFILKSKHIVNVMEFSTPCQKGRRIHFWALHWREKSFQWRKLTFSEKFSLLVFSFSNWTGILELCTHWKGACIDQLLNYHWFSMWVHNLMAQPE